MKHLRPTGWLSSGNDCLNCLTVTQGLSYSSYATFIGYCSASSISCFVVYIYLGQSISTTVTAKILYSSFVVHDFFFKHHFIVLS